MLVAIRNHGSQRYTRCMTNVALFPPLPKVPRPPQFVPDARQEQTARALGYLTKTLQSEMVIAGANLTKGFPAASVDLGGLKDAIESGLRRFDGVQVEERWSEIRAWIERVIALWVQRRKWSRITRFEKGVRVQLQTQDDLGYYDYAFDAFYRVRRERRGGMDRQAHAPQTPQAQCERLIVEVPKDRHAKIKARAALMRTSIKGYVVYAIYGFANAARAELVVDAERRPIDGSWHEKRFVVEVPPNTASNMKEAAKPFGTFREFALRCIDAEIASATSGAAPTLRCGLRSARTQGARRDG
jgi:hypothetical protein